MIVNWSDEALSDLERFDTFLRPKSARVAARVMETLTAAPFRLLDHPHAGERIENTGDVELRHLFVDHYEIQYEVRPSEIWIARIFHMRDEL
jgi:plasmid stabilization system protein ParE